MTTTQGETPTSVSSIFPTLTVLEVRPLKDNPSESCPSNYWSNQAAQRVTHLHYHLVGQMHLENRVLLKNPTLSNQAAGLKQQLSLDLRPRNHQCGHYPDVCYYRTCDSYTGIGSNECYLTKQQTGYPTTN